jgi:DNA-binding NarL/FixJ family response regulator
MTALGTETFTRRGGSATRPTERIAVQLHARDVICEAGVASQLRPRPEVRVVGPDEVDGARVTVVVVDTLDGQAMQVLRGLRARNTSRVVLVAGQIDDDDVMSAAEVGVIGMVRRSDATADRLVDVIRRAAAGEATLPPDLLSRLMSEIGRAQRQALEPGVKPHAGLRRREVDVLRLVAEGYDTVEIATRLRFSERTVKNVLHDVTNRLHLRNRSHAVAYALRHGLL